MNTQYYGRLANWRHTLYVIGAVLVFIAGVIGTVDSVYSLVTGHSIREDATPPILESSVTTVASCYATLVKPNVHVTDPEGGVFEKRTGLALVQLYAGADKIGEWPLVSASSTSNAKRQLVASLTVGGSKFERVVSVQGGAVIAVAFDQQGNSTAKELQGTFNAPYCFNPKRAPTSCDCTKFPAMPIEAVQLPKDNAVIQPQNSSSSANSTASMSSVSSRPVAQTK